MEIMVSKDVYDKAEKIAKELNTDVEAIFAIAAYRLIGTKICPFTHEKCYKRDRETHSHTPIAVDIRWS